MTYCYLLNKKIVNNLVNYLTKKEYFIYFWNYLIYNFITINLFLIINNLAVLFLLILNYIYYKKNHNLSVKLLYLFKKCIINSGVIYIKIIQWILSKEDLLNLNTKNLEIFKETFSNIFDNCYYHSYSYSQFILYNEFYKNLNNSYIQKNIKKILNIKNTEIFDIKNLSINKKSISSGSIAQIYYANYKTNNSFKKLCIKIVHPNIYLQCFWTNFFLNFIFYLFYLFNHNFFLFNIPFDYKNLYKIFLSQCNLITEYENLLQFYYNFIDNDFIIIPKPIFANKNILIMEYEDGEKLDDIYNDSDYTKNKIMLLLNLFNNDCFINKNIFHCDLHAGNWKIRKENNLNKIVIYDFGYCQQFNKNNFFKKLFHSWMSEDLNKIVEYSLEIFIKINHEMREKIFKYSKDYLKNIVGQSINFLDIINMLINISNKFNFKINNDPFNIILSFILIENNLKKYNVVKSNSALADFKTKQQKYNNIKQNCFNNIAFCKEYKIFNKMVDFYQEFIIENDYKFENNFNKNNKQDNECLDSKINNLLII